MTVFGFPLVDFFWAAVAVFAAYVVVTTCVSLLALAIVATDRGLKTLWRSCWRRR